PVGKPKNNGGSPVKKPWVNVYLADLDMWNGLRDGKPGAAPKPPQPPPTADRRNVTPTIGVGYSWSLTIDKIVDELEKGELIHRLYMMGHGGKKGGEFTIGRPLRWDDDAAIKEFRRLVPFTACWLTNVYILGCEAAADGPCTLGSLPMPD